MRLRLRMGIVLLIAMFVLFTSIPAHALANNFIMDEAGLLSEVERESISQSVRNYAGGEDFCVYILTVEDMGDYGFSDIEDFGYEIYESMGLGHADTGDGILLILSMEGRDYCIIKMGKQVSERQMDKIEKQLLSDLGEDAWSEAFHGFISDCYLAAGEKGKGGLALKDFLTDKMLGLGIFILIMSVFNAVDVCSRSIQLHKRSGKRGVMRTYVDPSLLQVHHRDDSYLRTTTHTIIHSSSSDSDSGSSSSRSGKF